jgi:hypothetical protein
MTTEEQTTITNFIGKLANKDYSEAQQALEDAVAAKLKNKIRNYVNQEEN